MRGPREQLRDNGAIRDVGAERPDPGFAARRTRRFHRTRRCNGNPARSGVGRWEHDLRRRIDGRISPCSAGITRRHCICARMSSSARSSGDARISMPRIAPARIPLSGAATYRAAFARRRPSNDGGLRVAGGSSPRLPLRSHSHGRRGARSARPCQPTRRSGSLLPTARRSARIHGSLGPCRCASAHLLDEIVSTQPSFSARCGRQPAQA